MTPLDILALADLIVFSSILGMVYLVIYGRP